MADPITAFKIREARNRAGQGEGVQVQEHQGDVRSGRRRSRRRTPSPESPPESPARMRRIMPGDDVFSILGIAKPDDVKDADQRKVAVMSGVASRLSGLAQKKSPAEMSK